MKQSTGEHQIEERSSWRVKIELKNRRPQCLRPVQYKEIEQSHWTGRSRHNSSSLIVFSGSGPVNIFTSEGEKMIWKITWVRRGLQLQRCNAACNYLNFARTSAYSVMSWHGPRDSILRWCLLCLNAIPSIWTFFSLRVTIHHDHAHRILLGYPSETNHCPLSVDNRRQRSSSTDISSNSCDWQEHLWNSGSTLWTDWVPGNYFTLLEKWIIVTH